MLKRNCFVLNLYRVHRLSKHSLLRRSVSYVFIPNQPSVKLLKVTRNGSISNYQNKRRCICNLFPFLKFQCWLAAKWSTRFGGKPDEWQKKEKKTIYVGNVTFPICVIECFSSSSDRGTVAQLVACRCLAACHWCGARQRSSERD